MKSIGISGIACYLPPYRVGLEAWCGWTQSNWEKLRHVVGNSFRMRGHHQNVYTMAAHAALNLIRQFDIDPRDIRYFALGTESSTDNSAGAVIVKGILDRGLRKLGLPPISRQCEVPEFKHACLGGVYAMKNAARYLAYDGEGAKAIVISADIAEYARGSSGEATQGAGAVAMLMEAQPKLLEVDLRNSGSAADYRGPDFRKPFVRFAHQQAATNGQLRDYPVFNGQYSTNCYIDEVLEALNDMFSKRGGDRASYLRSLTAVFFHRPYARMPETGWTMAYLLALSHGNADDHAELKQYCAKARVNFHDVVEELRSQHNIFSLVEQDKPNSSVFPKSLRVGRILNRFTSFHALADKLELGSEAMKDVGNLYTAALPAWLAAGLEEAVESNLELVGSDILTLGYGSGDAAEAIPMRAVPGWQEYAKKIKFAQSFDGAIDLNKTQYESLHSGKQPVDLPVNTDDEFLIKHVGQANERDFDEEGIEYYSYNKPAESKKAAPVSEEKPILKSVKGDWRPSRR